MESELSMASRAEITTRYAKVFKAPDRRAKGRILDEAVSVTGWSGLERHGEANEDGGRCSATVRAELLAMSPATIDRYLRTVQASDQIHGVSITKPSSLPRSSIKIRKAGDQVDIARSADHVSDPFGSDCHS